MLYDPNWKLPEVVVLEPWRQILLKAADIIETRGWTRGNLYRSGRSCALGAIMKASSPAAAIFNSEARISSEMLDRFLRKQKFSKNGGYIPNPVSADRAIVWWNDHVATNRKVIIETMREAAKEVLSE
jgi:hypothetical protein